MRRRTLLVAAGAAVVATVLVAPARPAAAHPLGNLTVNTYAGIVVRDDEITVDYVLDLAELPTVQAHAAHRPRRRRRRWVRPKPPGTGTSECASLLDGLEVSLGGRPLPLTSGAGSVRLLPGQGGLETLRLECPLRGRATLGDGADLSFTDGNFSDRIGWREITLAGDRTTVTGTRRARDRPCPTACSPTRPTVARRCVSVGVDAKRRARRAGPRSGGGVGCAGRSAGRRRPGARIR